MSSSSYLPSIQRYMTYYGMTTYIILGNIGLVFNIVIFIWPACRRNSCSIYILAASISGLIGLNFAAVPVVYALDHPNPVTTSLLFCQLQFYIRHAFNQMMRTFFIMCCADRYASTSNNIRLRSFSQFRIAIRMIPSVAILWLLLTIFPVMLRTLQNGKCEGKTGLPSIMLSVYIAIIVGVLPLITMLIFTLLMLKNLKYLRTRIQPITGPDLAMNGLRRRDRDMMRMLLIEIICYIGTTTPLAVNLVYQSATQLVTKNSEQQRIESFITYFTGTFLIYFNNSLSFWVYLVSSRSFRLEVRNLFTRFFIN